MPFAWTCALKDLRRFRRDPIQLLVWIGIPVFAAVMVFLVFGRERVVPRGVLLVADEDQSLVSSLLAGAYGQGPLGDMLTVEKVTPEAGRKRIDVGDGSALLRIPKGFGSAVLNGTPTHLYLVTNPAQNILPQIIQETTSLLGDAAFYLQAVAGDRLRSLATGEAPTDSRVAEAAVAFNRLGTAISGYLDPLRIELVTQTSTPKPEVDSSSLGATFLRSMLFLSVLFVALGFSGEIWKERRQGVLRRFLVAPARVESFLAGRLLGLGVILLLLTACGFGAGYAVLGAKPANLVVAGLFVPLAGLALYLLLQLLVLFAPNERAASVLGNLVMFPLAMAGGSFFPFEMMPGWLAAIGRWTPNGWAVTQVGVLLDGKAGPAGVLWMFAVVVVVGGAAFLMVARHLRRGFAL